MQRASRLCETGSMDVPHVSTGHEQQVKTGTEISTATATEMETETETESGQGSDAESNAAACSHCFSTYEIREATLRYHSFYVGVPTSRERALHRLL